MYQPTSGLGETPGDAFYSELGDNLKSLVMTGMAGWILLSLWKLTGSKSKRSITVRA